MIFHNLVLSSLLGEKDLAQHPSKTVKILNTQGGRVGGWMLNMGIMLGSFLNMSTKQYFSHFPGHLVVSLLSQEKNNHPWVNEWSDWRIALWASWWQCFRSQDQLVPTCLWHWSTVLKSTSCCKRTFCNEAVLLEKLCIAATALWLLGIISWWTFLRSISL